MKYKDINEFKKKKYRLWDKLGPAMKIPYAFYFKGNDLSKKEIMELIDLSEEDYERGIGLLIETKEVIFKESAKGRTFSLDERLKEEFYNQPPLSDD